MWECKKTTDQIAKLKVNHHPLSVSDDDKKEMKLDIFDSISIEDCTTTRQIIFEELGVKDKRGNSELDNWLTLMSDHKYDLERLMLGGQLDDGFDIDEDDNYLEFYEFFPGIEEWLKAQEMINPDLNGLIMGSMDGYLDTLLEKLWDETPACPHEDRL